MGIVLVVVGLLVGPGGVSVFQLTRDLKQDPAGGGPTVANYSRLARRQWPSRAHGVLRSRRPSRLTRFALSVRMVIFPVRTLPHRNGMTAWWRVARLARLTVV